LNEIRKLCATIKKHGKYSPKCRDSGVLLSVIYVCLKIEDGQNCVAVPVPVFRIPNYDPEVRVYVLLYLKFDFNFHCYTRKVQNIR
jgi:hypothetical protein